ncbi:hypothetical protein ABZP36_021219 [Zizania latifolia]
MAGRGMLRRGFRRAGWTGGRPGGRVAARCPDLAGRRDLASRPSGQRPNPERARGGRAAGTRRAAGGRTAQRRRLWRLQAAGLLCGCGLVPGRGSSRRLSEPSHIEPEPAREPRSLLPPLLDEVLPTQSSSVVQLFLVTKSPIPQ